ncbi:MAG TPA: PIN domain-containing protein [Thermomicrobiales bacterium]|nr:PIN domain-containing protein [Thermomicrobiales bacterium]
MSRFSVVLDACVLIPMSLSDTLLRAADADLYRLLWSEDILDEVRRNLVENGLTDDQRALSRVSQMRRTFPQASVTGYSGIVESMTNDPKDRHVLAAAVTAGAQVIVTSNLRDFPEHALSPYNIEAQSPDDFLLNLYGLAPGTLLVILQEQVAALRYPPMSTDQFLEYLSLHAPAFVDLVRRNQH